MVKINSNTDFNFEYEGEAIFENVNNQLIALNKKLESVDLPLIVSKRIYSISIELLYNTVYHGANSDLGKKTTHLTINSDDKHIYITSTNYILHNETEIFRSTLCKLNELGFDELRKMKAHQIKNGGITEKGGAGLGLIDICMKSGNKVEMTLKAVSKDLNLLTLGVKIDII